VRRKLTSETPTPADRPSDWAGFLQAAAALAGLAGVVYLVGAATLWVRYAAAGLPADVALAHQPRAEVIALGVRGLFAIGGIFVVVALILAYAFVYSRAPRRAAQFVEGIAQKVFKPSVPVVRDPQADVAPQTEGDLKGAWGRTWVTVAILAVIVCAYLGWREFGIAVAAVIAAGTLVRFARLRSQGDARANGIPPFLIVGLVSAAAISGTAWQVSDDIHVQSVIVQPPTKELGNNNTAVPYFGETDHYVYVLRVLPIQNGTNAFTYCSEVIELKRDSVTLTFPAAAVPLHPSQRTKLPSPLRVVVNAILNRNRLKGEMGVCEKPPER
jgi:hypothetical protein